jgi:hypothetical protein
MITLTREEAQQVLNALEEFPYSEGIKTILRNKLIAPDVMINGLTEQETAETMSVKGLSEPDDVPKWIYKKEVTEGTEAHHWAVVMHDMEKTVEGWSEDVKMYYDGKLIAPQPEPEPVAIVQQEAIGRGQVLWVTPASQVQDGTPLYTAPPQREWIGLTQKEVGMLTMLVQTMGGISTLGMYRILEKALKEKNGG